MTALRGIANEHGFDITVVDVLDADAAVMAAAAAAGVDAQVVRHDEKKKRHQNLGLGAFNTLFDQPLHRRLTILCRFR